MNVLLVPLISSVLKIVLASGMMRGYITLDEGRDDGDGKSMIIAGWRMIS